MNMSMIKAKASQLLKDKKGATMVEYAILLFLILVIAAAVYNTLGKSVCAAGQSATNQFQSH